MTLIAYSRLGARVFQLTSKYNHPAAREMPAYEVDHLDREIVQWYDNAPEEVKMKDWSQDKQLGATSSYNLKRLRIWTYLRYNQVRVSPFDLVARSPSPPLPPGSRYRLDLR